MRKLCAYRAETLPSILEALEKGDAAAARRIHQAAKTRLGPAGPAPFLPIHGSKEEHVVSASCLPAVEAMIAVCVCRARHDQAGAKAAASRVPIPEAFPPPLRARAQAWLAAGNRTP
jgi:hypothetical protein